MATVFGVVCVSVVCVGVVLVLCNIRGGRVGWREGGLEPRGDMFMNPWPLPHDTSSFEALQVLSLRNLSSHPSAKMI